MQISQGLGLGTRLHQPVGCLMDGIGLQIGPFSQKMGPHIYGIYRIPDKGEGQGLHVISTMLTHV